MRAGLEAFFDFIEERRGAWRVIFRNAGDPDVAEWLARSPRRASPPRSSR